MHFRLAGFLSLLMILAFQTACTITRTQEEPQFAGLAIFPPLQLPSKKTPIQLGRTSILWGDHDVVHGLDLSLIGNIVNKEFRGSAASAGFHATSGKARISGFQLASVANINNGNTKVEGFQMSAGMNYTGGQQRLYGFQLATLNVGDKNKVYGFQIGVYNQAEAIYGFQIGLLNNTKNLYGVQIGLLNFSENNGLPFCPILNIGF